MLPGVGATFSAHVFTVGKRSTFFRWPQSGSAWTDAVRWWSWPIAGKRSPALTRPGRRPRVGDGRGRRHACGSRDTIRLPRWARTRAVVLHECAHGMADDQHGPQFVATYVALLEQFAGLDRGYLLRTLALAKVRIALETDR